MILSYTKIIGMPVAELRNQEKIATVADLIFNDDCAVAAFLLAPKSFFSLWKDEKRVIPAEASITLVKDGLIVNSEDNICELTEMIRLKSLIERKLYGVRHIVKTDQGKFLGYVYDFLINTSTLSITKFYIRNILFEERIIPSSKVISFDKGTMVVKDESKPIGVSEPMAETAVN